MAAFNALPLTQNPLQFKAFQYIDGLVQDCNTSIANALEILQSCTKPLIYSEQPITQLITPAS